MREVERVFFPDCTCARGRGRGKRKGKITLARETKVAVRVCARSRPGIWKILAHVVKNTHAQEPLI